MPYNINRGGNVEMINSFMDGIIIALAIYFSIIIIVMIPMEIYWGVKEKRRIKKIRNKYNNEIK